MLTSDIIRRYEVSWGVDFRGTHRGCANFREFGEGEVVRRITLPGTSVNKGEMMSRWGNTGRDEGSVPIMGPISVGKREVACE
jgi:hypothetical protein